MAELAKLETLSLSRKLLNKEEMVTIQKTGRLSINRLRNKA